jgi:hypothetical protein
MDVTEAEAYHLEESRLPGYRAVVTFDHLSRRHHRYHRHRRCDVRWAPHFLSF